MRSLLTQRSMACIRNLAKGGQRTCTRHLGAFWASKRERRVSSPWTRSVAKQCEAWHAHIYRMTPMRDGVGSGPRRLKTTGAAQIVDR